MPGMRDEIDSVIQQLEQQTSGDYRVSLLQPLSISLTGLLVLGLIVMLRPGSTANLSSFVVVLASLLLSLFILWLTSRGKAGLASHLFCQGLNTGTIWFLISNLIGEQGERYGLMFGTAFSLSVLLAGMLLGNLYAFVFALADSFVLFVVFWYYFQVSDEVQPAALALGSIFPIVVILFMVAVISWLYQRALNQAAQRLELARQRIMRDELLRRDLAVARELQQRLYPPPPLTNSGLRIASRSEPARETSGDFYDFIELGDSQLGIVVADVTGKSIAAALVMAMTRSTLRSEATRHESPAEVLTHANQTLCKDRSVKQLITAFYGVLDTQTLSLHISNAGHPFPMIRRNGKLEEIEICGLPLGARPDALYTNMIVQLQPGDQLILISDGLLEEHNAKREIFGFERLLTAIDRADTSDCQQTLDDIWQAVARFRGSLEQSDDITLVVIQLADDVASEPYAPVLLPASG